MLNILNCPNCGHEIENEDQFCGYCGTKLNQEKPAEKAEEKQEKIDKTQKKSQKEIKLIGGIIVCLLLIVSAVNIGRLTEENYRNDTRSKNSYSSEVPMPAGITTDEDYEQQEEETTTQISAPIGGVIMDPNIGMGGKFDTNLDTFTKNLKSTGLDIRYSDWQDVTPMEAKNVKTGKKVEFKNDKNYLSIKLGLDSSGSIVVAETEYLAKTKEGESSTSDYLSLYTNIIKILANFTDNETNQLLNTSVKDRVAVLKNVACEMDSFIYPSKDTYPVEGTVERKYTLIPISDEVINKNPDLYEVIEI